ncbi:unnamed protein product [Heterobilharzia americana]|nr:unnamed protein product [Heterobilharzia americana]
MYLLRNCYNVEKPQGSRVPPLKDNSIEGSQEPGDYASPISYPGYEQYSAIKSESNHHSVNPINQHNYQSAISYPDDTEEKFITQRPDYAY